MKSLLMAILFVLAVSTNAKAIDAVITFTDNSGGDPLVNNGETGFRIQRNLNNGLFTDIATAPASPGAGITVQVIDTTLVESQTTENKYCYRVYAFNATGNSGFANTQIPGVTDCKVIAQLLIVPAGPAGILVK